ncbi:succinate dehydrogenase / fumarate reductase cytochrome b subunit [Lacibacter cauensis]|uniref:Succinate dehydrogenase / fumarate reductase cytochrome b subunit n=1 Tax=Lacibacter cauensis TaxID=510947 RepID=A0A562SVU2_9BACT|nr:succinate dehydrogenase cytochrome b subunit [Lacibacter cauensis]TWI85385.1 succinate dehydrogenase / fumarate reductase cytochrome b subunit [Lacibacter cauensis]
MTFKQMFTSSIGKKLVMGLTGLFLISFLIVHVSINACIFADLFNPDENGEMFNKAAHFMGSTVLIRILEVGLMAGIVLHIVQGYMLEMLNRKARAVGYDKPMGNVGSKWYSRSMGLLGTLLLLFFILHFSHFWVPARFTHQGLDIPVTYNGVDMHDMFGLMKVTFSQLWVVIAYIIGCISLFWHLMHGFQSAFRTVGVSNNRYLSLLNNIGIGFSLIVSVLFALMPIAMYLEWIG